MRRVEGNSMGSAVGAKCELAAESLRSFGTLQFPATGWSMFPTIRPNDLLVVDRVSSGQLCIGDVIVFSRAGRLCGHRLMAREGTGKSERWITQGDALPTPDGPVSAEEILGRVRALLRAGRTVPLGTEIRVIDRWIATAVRRLLPAARMLASVNRTRRSSAEPVLP